MATKSIRQYLCFILRYDIISILLLNEFHVIY